MLDNYTRGLAYQMYVRQAERLGGDDPAYVAEVWCKDSGIEDFWMAEAVFVIDTLRDLGVLPA